MKAILITGTSRGLGKAVFDQLASYPVHLICLSRRFLPYQGEMAKTNSNIQLIQVFLDQVKSINNSIENINLNWSNEIDELIFINNAGNVEPINSIGHLSSDMILQSVNVNFIAPILISNSLINKAIENNFKFKIINISSGAAKQPIVGWGMYCSTKAATKMFFDVVEKQFQTLDDIKVVNIDPGVINTNMQACIREADESAFPRKDEFVDLFNRGLLSSPENVANRIISEYIGL